jgi:hypothetical protein
LYILLSFYLLPALAAILKVRKRKLAMSGVSSEGLTSVVSSSVLADATNSLVSDINVKMASLDSAKSQGSSISSTLNVLSLKIETLRQFNLSVLSQTQLTTLFFK